MPATDLTPVDRVRDALAAAGCNPRAAGPAQWTARCPVQDAHKRGDKNPSLSIGESPTGKALITCHAGCTVPAIAEALRLRMADLFPRDDVRQAATSGIGTEKARYPYHDEAGELLFEVVKFVKADGTKTFRARKPDGAGGWSWSTAGVRRVIYKLPEVLAAVADGRPVVICEGEKDAETASWLFAEEGAATTCNPFGAGKWHESYNESFRGAHVRIIADDDHVGRAHADVVATHLAGIAASVTVWLPATGHKDLSEMVGAGLAIADLRAVDAHTAPDPVTVDDDPPEAVTSMLVDWPEFWSTEIPAEDWVVEPLIPAGRSVAIYAPAKTGKSLVLLSAVAAAAAGRSVWGLPARSPRHVLYLDYEMTTADLRERLELLGYDADADLSHLHYALIPSLPPLDTAEGGARLLELVHACGAECVVIDTLGRAAEGDENDADTIRAYYRHTGSLLKRAGIATGRTDHAGKDSDKGQRGSSAKNDDVDVVWKVERTQEGVTLKRTHSRMTWVPEVVALDRIEDDEAGTWTFRRAVGSMAGVPEGTAAAIGHLDTLGLPAGVGANAAQRALKEAGIEIRRVVVLAAVKARRREAGRALTVSGLDGNQSGNHPLPVPDGTTAGTTNGNTPLPAREPPGNHREPLAAQVVPVSSLSKEGTGTAEPEPVPRGGHDPIDPSNPTWKDLI